MKPKAKEKWPPPPKSRWPNVSPRARQIWRDTVSLVPGYKPLFESILVRYCDHCAFLEKLSTDFANMDPTEARRCRKPYRTMRRAELRAIARDAAQLLLTPASRSELN
jgi:hypothetical protein